MFNISAVVTAITAATVAATAATLVIAEYERLRTYDDKREDRMFVHIAGSCKRNGTDRSIMATAYKITDETDEWVLSSLLFSPTPAKQGLLPPRHRARLATCSDALLVSPLSIVLYVVNYVPPTACLPGWMDV
eukprot:GHVU01124903.1.p1 GENE.GHVU01124903.1~~GHVU01124903.1.p1  ORF type:complete len:133 (+),score=9.83 GHVU01124903.1:82-480(+)